MFWQYEVVYYHVFEMFNVEAVSSGWPKSESVWIDNIDSGGSVGFGQFQSISSIASLTPGCSSGIISSGAPARTLLMIEASCRHALARRGTLFIDIVGVDMAVVVICQSGCWACHLHRSSFGTLHQGPLKGDVVVSGCGVLLVLAFLLGWPLVSSAASIVDRTLTSFLP